MGKKIDTLYTRKKQEEAEHALAIFFPTCRKNHGSEECPYNRTKIFSLEEASKGLKLKSFPIGTPKVEYFEEPMYFMKPRHNFSCPSHPNMPNEYLMGQHKSIPFFNQSRGYGD